MKEVCHLPPYHLCTLFAPFRILFTPNSHPLRTLIAPPSQNRGKYYHPITSFWDPCLLGIFWECKVSLLSKNRLRANWSSMIQNFLCHYKKSGILYECHLYELHCKMSVHVRHRLLGPRSYTLGTTISKHIKGLIRKKPAFYLQNSHKTGLLFPIKTSVVTLMIWFRRVMTSYL